MNGCRWPNLVTLKFHSESQCDCLAFYDKDVVLAATDDVQSTSSTGASIYATKLLHSFL